MRLPEILYVIDLDEKRLEIQTLDRATIKTDLKHFKVKNWRDLVSPDWRLFETAEEATEFLERAEEARSALKRLPAVNGAPHLLYKRRYMLQSALGLKLKTVRTYLKDWKPGTVFNLHDQTFYLPVRLKEISSAAGEHTYHFALLD